MNTPREMDVWAGQAAQLLQQRRPAEALAICQQMLAKDPKSVVGLHLMGGAELGLNRIPQAADLFRQAHALAPNDSQIALNLGMALLKTGQLPDAVAAFENVVRIKPQAVKVYDTLCKLYVQTSAAQRGIAFLKTLQARAPDIYELSLQLAVLCAMDGAWPDAERYAQHALMLRQDGWLAHYCLANALLTRGEYAQAVERFGSGLSIPNVDAQGQKLCGEARTDTAMVARLAEGMKADPSLGEAKVDVRDEWEAQAIAAIKEQCRVPKSAPLNAVFFHVDASGEHPFLKLAASGAENVDYRTALLAACRAARGATPEVAIFLITDATSDTSYLPADVQVLRLDIDSSQMMYSRMRSYRALVLSGVMSGPVLFLDTDVCLNRDFGPLFDGDFDIGVTYRSDMGFLHMPLNEGVLLAADARSSALASFFGQTLNLYGWIARQGFVTQRYGFDVRMWRGGQLSLAAFIKWQAPAAPSATVEIGGLRCRFFPCNAFNYAVKAADTPPLLHTKWAVHFKGAKVKHLMASYLERGPA